MKMKEAFEKAKAISKEGEGVYAEYVMSTFNAKPCRLYIEHLGNFEAYTWEQALEALIGKIIGVPLPPDEDGSLEGGKP